MKYFNVTRRTATMAAAMVGGLLLMQTLSASGAFAQQLTARKFYLTKTGFDGASALTACAAGFHMASLWEIFNPAVLEYDTILGKTAADSGSGPPTTNYGWIRTGEVSSGVGSVGLANCKVWTSNLFGYFGSAVRPEADWNTTTVNAIRPWKATIFTCDQVINVWCVQDFDK